MFRLAEKYDFKELQDASLKAIIEGITKTNVVEEYFSTITVRYRRVREAQLPFLRAQLPSESVKSALRQWTEAIKDNPTLKDYWADTCTDLFLP